MAPELIIENLPEGLAPGVYYFEVTEAGPEVIRARFLNVAGEASDGS